jgi:hypothetical protein
MLRTSLRTSRAIAYRPNLASAGQQWNAIQGRASSVVTVGPPSIQIASIGLQEHTRFGILGDSA